VKSISKYLALVLRHKPEVAGLALDAEGWASADAVIAAIARKFGEFDRVRTTSSVMPSTKAAPASAPVRGTASAST
jgi:putative RNA 2'-phosphotransferase